MPADPLVTAIMPTADRPTFAAQAIEMFLAQTWPNKELVILDSGSRAIDPPNDPRIRYFRTPRSGTLGAKRNLACSHARGEFICFWDDDDLYAEDRIEDQARRLIETGKVVTGYHTMLFVDTATGELWRWRYRAPDSAIGVSLMFRRDFWVANPFNPERHIGEDFDMVQAGRHRNQIVCVDGERHIVATIHAGNTARRKLTERNWERVAA